MSTDDELKAANEWFAKNRRAFDGYADPSDPDYSPDDMEGCATAAWAAAIAWYKRFLKEKGEGPALIKAPIGIDLTNPPKFEPPSTSLVLREGKPGVRLVVHADGSITEVTDSSKKE